MKNLVARRFELMVRRAGLSVCGLVGAALFSVLPQTVASVYTLPPNSTITALPSDFPGGGSVVSNYVSTFTSGTIDGMVTSTVISGDSLNPYHGGLTFEYLLTMTGGSDSSGDFTVGSYAGFQTDVSYSTNAPGVAPSFFSRDGGVNNDDTLEFQFVFNKVKPGESSELIIVQTDATSFQGAVGHVIDSTGAPVTMLAPVPEPAVGGLLAVGLGLVFAFRRRTSK